MRRVSVFAVVLLLLVNLPEPRLAAAVTDAPDSAATPAPEAPPAPAKGSSEGRIPIGVGVKVSTLESEGKSPSPYLTAPTCALGLTLSVTATPSIRMG